MSARFLFLFVLGAALQSCNTPLPEAAPEAQQQEAAAGEEEQAPAVPVVVNGTAQTEQQRLLADLLFEGLQALDEDRLLTPIDDNAHARFKRVIAYDRDNEIALQGLRDIVLRYVELAVEATNRGLFEDAQQMLERARFVDGDHPAIADAAAALQEEMDSDDLFFELDYNEFSNRTK
jgi:hypothetical protein